MKLRKPLLVAGGALLLVSAAWAADTVLASAGNITVTDSEIRQLLRDQHVEPNTLPVREMAVLVGNELARKIITAEAKKAGFDKKPDVQRAMTRAADNAMTELWVAQQAQLPPGYPSEADVQSFYDANKTKLLVPKKIQVAQIFIKGTDDAAVKRAQALDADLKAHPDHFAETAKTQSDDKASGARGGDLGWVPVANLAPALSGGIANLAKGQVSNVLSDGLGQHIVLVEDRADERQATIDESRPQIEQILRQQKVRQLQEAYFERVKGQYSESVNKEAIAAMAAPSSNVTQGSAPAGH